uniref:Nuclear receptor domain-containing protein n=1 Tax=Parastrongyloides trichosuri TaxID=131310 RepID=A0A0N4Z368_PARTI
MASSHSQSNGKTIKVCVVCGDNAFGTNFGVVSCESCKAFYRRNCLRENIIFCPFQRNCKITINSRRNCQACRLQKCIAVGMKKDVIVRETSKRFYQSTDINEQKKVQEIVDDNLVLKKSKEHVVENKDDIVNISKSEYIDLVNKLKSFEKQLNSKMSNECTCVCNCGFYPKDKKFIHILKEKEEKIKYEIKNSVFEGDRSNSYSSNQNIKNDSIPFSNTISQTHINYYQDVLFGNKKEDYEKNLFGNRKDAFEKNTMRNMNVHQVYLNNSVKDFVNIPTSSISNQLPKIPFSEMVSRNMNNSIISTQNNGNMLFLQTPPSSVAGNIGNEHLLLENCHINLPSFMSSPPSVISCHNSTPNMASFFDTWEMDILSELIKSNSIMKEPVDAGIISPTTEFSLQDIVEFTNLALRRTIQMSKKLGLFNNLCQTDQMALVKGGASEILILRGAMVYDIKTGRWKHYAYQGAADIMIKIDILKSSPEQSHYLKHKNFLDTFSERWRLNEEVMLLLNVIILFNSTRPNLTNINDVNAANAIYKQILKKYLIYQCCNDEEAQREYECLLIKLKELEELNKGLISIYSLLTLNDLDPLLIELFDLK